MVTKVAIDQLPGLPHVLIEVLEAISSDKADYKSISKTIRYETAITAKLISAANSSFFGNSKPCDSIERALLLLGTETVKTIVITTSIKQFFNNFSQQHDQFLKSFWRRSLISANIAKVLATLTSYPNPDEAYLSGLLTGVGELMLLTSHQDQYLTLVDESHSSEQLLKLEMQQFSTTHCNLSADLIESWKIPGFMADAARYQHEPVDTILDAHHLVKIINLARMLSSDTVIDDNSLTAADKLFGLNESLTRELISRIGNDADNIAKVLGIDISSSENDKEVQLKLGKKLGDLAELAHISAELWQASNQESLQSAVNRALFLTYGITNNILFLYDEEQNLLTGQANNDQQKPNSLFTVPAVSERSLISDSLLSRKTLRSQDRQPNSPLNIIDRQLLRYLNAEHLICWPLVSSLSPDSAIGVLVLGLSGSQLASLESKSNLSSSLAKEIADAIFKSTQKIKQFEAESDHSEGYQQQISEAVHEASNPLSIIRNYLELLSFKLGEDHNAKDEINLIKEEIDRVGHILLRLKEPDQTGNTDGPLNVNEVIESIAHIFRSSICTSKEIELNLNLDPSMAQIQGNSEHLKQIVTNLLKNAVEALPPKGVITVSSEASTNFSGRQFIGIYIDDNGPGIDENIKNKLFSPVTSTKGSGHSGLGLSIVKKLIDDMDGTIVCRSNPNIGTQFQILLPKTAHAAIE